MAVAEFTAKSSVSVDFAGSPALDSIKDALVAGGWTLVERTFAVGTYFLRDLQLATDPPLDDDDKTDPLSCDFYYNLAFNFNGTPPVGIPIVPYDPGAHMFPPSCPYHTLGLTYEASLANLIGAISSYTEFEVTDQEGPGYAGYAKGYLLTVTAKAPGPEWNYNGFWSDGWRTAFYQQPQNGGYVLESQAYNGNYLRVTIGENDLAPVRLWFDFQLNGAGTKYRQRLNSNTEQRYRIVASPHQMLIYVPSEGTSSGSGGSSFLMASTPWRPDDSPAIGGAFVVGNWDERHAYGSGGMRHILTAGASATAVSLENENFTAGTGYLLSVPTLHTTPGTPVLNVQENAISQSAFITARRNDGTYDTTSIRLLGKLWNCMVLSKHFDLATDRVSFDGERWMLISSQAGHQQGSLWMLDGS